MDLNMDKCHYCGSYTTNSKDNYYEHTMYGVVKSHLIRGMGYTYIEKKIKIPRCESCCNKHTNQFSMIEIPIFIISFIIWIWVFTYKVGKDGFKFISLIPSIGISIVITAILSSVIRFFISSSEKSGKQESDIKRYKEVRELTAFGWKINKPAKSEYITDKDLLKDSPYRKD
ncbi:hypothetical protein [Flavobacterium sp.]